MLHLLSRIKKQNVLPEGDKDKNIVFLLYCTGRLTFDIFFVMSVSCSSTNDQGVEYETSSSLLPIIQRCAHELVRLDKLLNTLMFWSRYV